MGRLSELVKRDFEEEVKVIEEAGRNLWVSGFGMAIILAIMWGFDLLFREPWTKKEIGCAMICVIVFPFIDRAWERHKVAARIRHEREVRVELKLDALLGLVNINDV
ncbi:MAG: hypothetical protein ABR923_10500, partial [Terracidiphilus sp.]